MHSRTRTVAAMIAGVVCVSSSTLAGDLNPPAGAVSPTGKTLTEVEPRIALSAENTPGDSRSVFRITQPGSYVLTSDVSVPNNDTGINAEFRSGTTSLWANVED